MNTSSSNNRTNTWAKPAAILFAGIAAGAIFSDAFRPAAAVAQDIPRGQLESPFNATEQRKQMIAQLVQMNERLTRVETKLNTGISVKVTEMPPVTVKEAGK